MLEKKAITGCTLLELSVYRGALVCVLLMSVVSPARTQNKDSLLRELITINDAYVPQALGRQLVMPGHQYHGAVFDADSVVSPIGTAQLVQTLICAYVSPQSEYFRSSHVLQRMTDAATALVNLQHEDGTIDLLTTNFHSTPDLGFTIFPLGLSYSIMLQHPHINFGEFPGVMRQYLLKAGKALAVGGIHTPNHRWVVCAALAWVYSFFPDVEYKSRINEWLAEKIDIDADGQYSERSTAVYTPVTNRSLIDIARKMKYDDLLDVIGRNLDLTLFLVHANGEIATETSNRQDQYVRRNMAGYYHAYNYMALRRQKPEYAGMVQYIRKTVPPSHLLYMLPLFLEDRTLLAKLPEAKPIPTRYHKHFPYSDMVRIREDSVDMTIITSNPSFFTLFNGEAALEGVRLSAAFFGKGQFQSQQMKKQGDTYVLSATMTAPYYQPLPKEKIPDETDAWTKVPRTERRQSEVQTLRMQVSVTPGGRKATITVTVEGPENLPVTIEFGFRRGGMLRGVTPHSKVADSFLANHGEYVIYQMGQKVIRLGPAARTHNWTQLRGALPKLEADCVYFTAYAPCNFEFTIEAE